MNKDYRPKLDPKILKNFKQTWKLAYVCVNTYLKKYVKVKGKVFPMVNEALLHEDVWGEWMYNEPRYKIEVNGNLQAPAALLPKRQASEPN
jgi:hypothetical protein